MKTEAYNAPSSGLGTDASSTERAAANLKKWHSEIARLKELASLQITMIAREIGDESAAASEGAPLYQTLATLLEEGDTPLLHRLTVAERLDFCRTRLEGEEAAPHAPSLAEIERQDTVKIACLDSPLFAEAHTLFSELFPTAAPALCPTFAEVPEEVVAGSADFGILPIENARDGKLFRFYEQIERHELHIFATKSATLGEGEESTRFALISKAPPPLPHDAEKVMECVVFEEDAFSLSDILFVAASCGITLRRIDSLPASFGKGHFLHHPIFHAVNGDFRLFETYLDLFMPRTIITARYINLKG